MGRTVYNNGGNSEKEFILIVLKRLEIDGKTPRTLGTRRTRAGSRERRRRRCCAGRKYEAKRRCTPAERENRTLRVNQQGLGVDQPGLMVNQLGVRLGLPGFRASQT